MIKTYRKTFTTECNGSKFISPTIYLFLSDESEIKKEEKVHVTWKNIDEFFKRYEFQVPFNFYRTQRGRVIEPFSSRIPAKERKCWKAKEWKTDINIIFTIETEEREVSIKDILDYPHSDIAIQYLAERGLQVMDS